MLYDFVKKDGGWSNFEMVLFETKHCNGALDAQRVSRTYIEKLHETLNGAIRVPADKVEGDFQTTEQPEDEQDESDALAVIIEEAKEPPVDEEQASSSTAAFNDNNKENTKEQGERSPWVESLKQVAAMGALTDEDDKVIAILNFLSLIQQIETTQMNLNKELEEHTRWHEARVFVLSVQDNTYIYIYV
jgi:hypothetical protein